MWLSYLYLIYGLPKKILWGPSLNGGKLQTNFSKKVPILVGSFLRKIRNRVQTSLIRFAWSYIVLFKNNQSLLDECKENHFKFPSFMVDLAKCKRQLHLSLALKCSTNPNQYRKLMPIANSHPLQVYLWVKCHSTLASQQIYQVSIVRRQKEVLALLLTRVGGIHFPILGVRVH